MMIQTVIFKRLDLSNMQDNNYYEEFFSDAYTAKDTGFGTAIEENFL